MTFRNIMLFGSLGGLLSGCAMVGDYVEQGRPYAANVASEMAQAECQLSLANRKLNAAAVVQELSKAGSPAKFFALDCDGDGQPDF